MEFKLDALVVEDEESAGKILKTKLEDTRYFDDIRIASSVASALEELTHFEPDLIFLDIEMPGRDGFSLIKDIPERRKVPAIIIVTGYDQYAIKAIKNDVFDYLLKPVKNEELKKCIERYCKTIQNGQNLTTAKLTGDLKIKIPKIKVNSRTGILFINPSSIIYCKAEGNYSSICTGEKKHISSLNISKLEKILSTNGFKRFGRSYILNLEYISLLDHKENTVTLKKGDQSVKVKIPRHHLKDIEAT